MIYEIPMSDRNKPSNNDKLPDLWLDKYIDIDARNLIDVRMAMTDPAAKKIRGKVFSTNDRIKVAQVVRKIAELHLMPFVRGKIRTLEDVVSKSRKGIRNTLFNTFIKKNERGENDGLKDGFRMSKSDLELRNLADLAFVSQDYETACQNAQYPLKDFR